MLNRSKELRDKEIKYLEFVESVAENQGKVFMLDTGEGRDFEDPISGWYIEDFSGWLIEKNQKEQFLDDKDRNFVNKEFSDNYVFAEWLKDDNGHTCVKFVNYPSFE